ncbi:hypothetical protein J2B92_12440 [Lysinibacillus sphaericus]|uniref:hypothetical protein n=1 Tax=Lysinibacillus sphaericus TaxID=1421 RepID=UPI0018CEA8BC|nr:hypothetical protein [Lysinibacillus sphaericus]MBG9756084.1 hypothetical protein [Lysinibacillus sphaericus]QTB11753.1 hypothetical protein J2B92_12440 [Lysinibacillus sphaericus]
MILDLFDSSLDGNFWEELIVKCYRMRYQGQHFTPIPANYKGDGGIEGFTKSGIAIQCYCPEDLNSSNQVLYDKLRDKMTKDINKFIDIDYAKRLKKMGLPIIKEWHFVTPIIKDNRIINHAASKIKEVLEARNSNPTEFEYISESFDIVLKVAEDFNVELSRIMRLNVTDLKINLVFDQQQRPDWHKCGSIKIKNVERKLLAIQPGLVNDGETLNQLLDMYMTFYMLGIEQLDRLKDSFPDIRKDILELTAAYKSEVTIKTLFNTDKTLNSNLFIELGNNFEEKLRSDFNFLTSATIMNLKNNIVASWLADCSMEFKGD